MVGPNAESVSARKSEGNTNVAIQARAPAVFQARFRVFVPLVWRSLRRRLWLHVPSCCIDRTVLFFALGSSFTTLRPNALPYPLNAAIPNQGNNLRRNSHNGAGVITRNMHGIQALVPRNKTSRQISRKGLLFKWEAADYPRFAVVRRLPLTRASRQ